MQLQHARCAGLDVPKKQHDLVDSDGSENEAYCAHGRWSKVVQSLVR
jgi:hypothetical protein